MFSRIDRKIIVRIMFFILFVINVSWFSNYKFHSLMGDDLRALDAFNNYGSSFWRYVFLDFTFDRYRPVFSFVSYIIFKLFGANLPLYYYFSIALNFVIACLFFKIIRLTTNNIFFAFLFSLILITTRFSYYNILQIMGIMEAMGLLLFLVIVYYSILYYKENRNIYFYWLVFYDLLLVFTHERYLILTPVIIVLVIFKNGIKTDWNRKIKYSIVSVLPFVGNLLIKSFMDSKILSGTGGTTVEFHLKLIVGFIKTGFVNMIGFNDGPNYLSGQPFQESTNITIWTSILISTIILLTMILYVVHILKQKETSNKTRELLICLLVVLTVGALVFISSITIRLEFRWLYAPYAAFLIFIAYSINKSIASSYLKYTVLILLVVFTFRNDAYYKEKMKDTFFVGYQTFMNSMYDETIGKYGTSLSNYKIYILRDGMLDWPLYGQLYFQFYTGDRKFEFQYVDDFSKVSVSLNDKVIFLKLDVPNKKIVTMPVGNNI
ncbi:hypothetical protein ASL11_00750 [Paenibacillus sp. Soil750]|nr:hypothetical protein ASL11_00750 [Paenibacillus sp. Soil750]